MLDYYSIGCQLEKRQKFNATAAVKLFLINRVNFLFFNFLETNSHAIVLIILHLQLIINNYYFTMNI